MFLFTERSRHALKGLFLFGLCESPVGCGAETKRVNLKPSDGPREQQMSSALRAGSEDDVVKLHKLTKSFISPSFE